MSNNTGPTISNWPAQDLWLGQFIYLDGSSWVHIAQSRAAAFEALAAKEELEIPAGQTAQQVVEEILGESETTSYNVMPVDSISLA